MARTKKTTVKQTSQTFVVDEDGVIKESETSRTMQWESEPDYIKVYLDDICYLTNTPKFCSNVLQYLLKYVTYADNTEVGGLVVCLSTYTRKLISKKLGFTQTQSLSNAINKLVKGKVLFKLGGGAYRLNPYLFGKGDWKDIKQLRTTIIWDGSGKTIQTEIDRIERKPIKNDNKTD